MVDFHDIIGTFKSCNIEPQNHSWNACIPTSKYYNTKTQNHSWNRTTFGMRASSYVLLLQRGKGERFVALESPVSNYVLPSEHGPSLKNTKLPSPFPGQDMIIQPWVEIIFSNSSC